MTKKVDMSSSFDPTDNFKAKKSVSLKDKERFKVHKIAEHKFGAIYYKTKLDNGNSIFGEGKVDFLEDKYKQKHPAYMYNFEKFMINKPLTSNAASSILDEDDDTIFSDANSVTTNSFSSNAIKENDNLVEPIVDTDDQPAVPSFDFNNTNDFDIVIDTGDNKQE